MSSELNKLIAKTEAIIFASGGVINRNKLKKQLQIDNSVLEDIVDTYNQGGGLSMILDDKNIMLGIAPEFSEYVKTVLDEEIKHELTSAGREVLSIILYNNGATSSEIDYIRGVNSNYILRRLAMRGLISKNKIGGTYLYKPTAELLAHLGITSMNDLPDSQEITEKLNDIKQQYEREN